MNDADTIARIAVDTILGNHKFSAFDALKLKGVYDRFCKNPELKAEVVHKLAERLVESAPDLASKLCDALASRVGR